MAWMELHGGSARRGVGAGTSIDDRSWAGAVARCGRLPCTRRGVAKRRLGQRRRGGCSSMVSADTRSVGSPAPPACAERWHATVTAVDLPGFGLTWTPWGRRATLERTAWRAPSVTPAVGPAAVAGNSMGGALGIGLAVRGTPILCALSCSSTWRSPRLAMNPARSGPSWRVPGADAPPRRRIAVPGGAGSAPRSRAAGGRHDGLDAVRPDAPRPRAAPPARRAGPDVPACSRRRRPRTPSRPAGCSGTSPAACALTRSVSPPPR